MTQAVRSAFLRQSGGVAPDAEPSAEIGAAVGLAQVGRDERQMLARRSVEDGLQASVHRNGQLGSCFFLRDINRAIANVLRPYAARRRDAVLCGAGARMLTAPWNLVRVDALK